MSQWNNASQQRLYILVCYQMTGNRSVLQCLMTQMFLFEPKCVLFHCHCILIVYSSATWHCLSAIDRPYILLNVVVNCRLLLFINLRRTALFYVIILFLQERIWLRRSRCPSSLGLGIKISLRKYDDDGATEFLTNCLIYIIFTAEFCNVCYVLLDDF